MPTIIFDRYHRYIEVWPEPSRTQVEEVAELSRSVLEDKYNDFKNQLDALPQYEVVTRDKRFLDLVALGISSAALTLSTFNTVKISKLESQIVNNNKRLDHLVDITALHEQHFKAVDQKVDDMAALLVKILRQCIRHSGGWNQQYDCGWSLSILSGTLFHGSPRLQQDGGDLLLQGKECPPD